MGHSDGEGNAPESPRTDAASYVESALMRDKRVEAEQGFAWGRPIMMSVVAFTLVGNVWLFWTRGIEGPFDAVAAVGLMLGMLVFAAYAWRLPPVGRVISVSSTGLVIEVRSQQLNLSLSDVQRAKASFVQWGGPEDGSPRMKSVFKCVLVLKPGLPYRSVMVFDDRRHSIASTLASARAPVAAEYERDDNEEWSIP